MTPAFGVQVPREVDARVRLPSTPRAVRRAFAQAYRDLGARGCAAADYRLSGPGEWPRHCVKILPWGWKLVMDFPAQDEVRVLILEPHDNHSDPYSTLARILGVERAPGLDSGKPPCCDPEGLPPDPG